MLRKGVLVAMKLSQDFPLPQGRGLRARRTHDMRHPTRSDTNPKHSKQISRDTIHSDSFAATEEVSAAVGSEDPDPLLTLVV